jgi:predicted phosphoribosyltransferase
LTDWARASNLIRSEVASCEADDRIVIVVDHGQDVGASVFEGAVVVFAGPKRTADDVIADTVRFFSQVVKV